MAGNESILVYFFEAGFVVKFVMLLLIGASILSWTFIFQRGLYLKNILLNIKQFEERFWRSGDLAQLYSQVKLKKRRKFGLMSIFESGYDEYISLSKKEGVSVETKLLSVQRAMRVAKTKEIERLEKHLPFLATVGSVSPYIGLFGTVWGIMTAFHALGNVQQASIAMVAPGISEALIATAMGLFAAIPAVIAYNRYVNEVERIVNQFDIFEDEFSSLLLRNGR